MFGRENPAVLFLGPLLLFVSCEDKFMKQTTADKTAAIATLQTKLDDSGNHVASFDPTKSETQLMRITSGAIAGAAVAIPPAALSIPVSIAVGEGVSLATSSFSQTLGITDNKINAGGPSVSFTASQDVVATNPMTLSIPFGPTSLNLNDVDTDNIIVMYRWTTIENGATKFEAGILPGENVTRAKNKVSFQTTKFGTFQVGVAEKKITTAVATKTEEPPALKSCERYAAEVFPNCTTHGQVGCLATDAFRAVDMTLLKAEFILSGASIQDVQGNVVLPAASQVRDGTPFGAGGNQFTGTFSLNSDNPAIKACERYTAAVYQPCSKDGQVGCVTTDAFKAADMTLIRPEIILTGRIIAGVAGTVVLPSPDKVIVGRTYGPATASVTGTSFAAAPTLSYQGATGTKIKLGETFSVSPTSWKMNGSNITSCRTQVETTSLPAGVAINQTTCTITGAPTALLNPTTFKIVATNSVGSSTAADITLALLDTAATPTFSPAGGAYGPSQTVTITSSTPGATIYYTTDGSTPTVSSNPYVAAITVTATQTIKAVATHGNFHDSHVGSASFTINGPVASPTFSVSSGSYNGTQTVAITSATPGASIYFTTNGTTPSPSSPLYTGPVTISSTQTLGAIATKSGFSNSLPAYADYVIDTTPPLITLGSITTNSPGTTQTPTVQFTSNETGTFWLSSKAGCSTDFISSSNILIASNNSATTFSLASNATTEIYVKAKDALGNQSCTLVASYTHDDLNPSVTITSTVATNTNVSPIPVTITFSESVTGFTDADVTVTNGSKVGFSGSGSTYVVNVDPVNEGLVTVNVAASAAQDVAGNSNTATQISWTFDSVAPTLSAASVQSISPSTSNFTPTVVFTLSEAATVTLFSDTCTTSISSATSLESGPQTMNTNTLPDSALTTIYVRGVDSTGNTSLCTLIGSYTTQLPAVSLNTPISGNAQLGLNWSTIPGATYDLYWSPSNNVTSGSNKLSNVSQTYWHTSLTNGVAYYYRLAAVKNGITGQLSSLVSATPNQNTGLRIYSISPATGPESGGTVATIYGDGFSSNSVVKIGVNTATVRSFSSTSISITTPSGSLGPKNVVVADNTAGQSITLSPGFNYHIPFEVLVIGGGGGGGMNGGGGGGGGGLINTMLPIQQIPTGTLNVRIGNGGLGSDNTNSPGQNGYESKFGDLVANGGGGGGSYSNSQSASMNGMPGGSGGGASLNFQSNGSMINPTGGSSTPQQGRPGGNADQAVDIYTRNTGGGGGAGGIGTSGASDATKPNGGIGLQLNITGSPTYYAGGGGGGSGVSSNQTFTTAGPGTGGQGGGGGGGGKPNVTGAPIPTLPGGINTGGGGGGSGEAMGTGGQGGSGVVIIAYPDTYPALTFIASTLTYTIESTRPNYRVYRFTSGAGDISWTSITPPNITP